MLTEQLFRFKKRFDEELERYFDKKISEARASKELSEGMLKVLKEYTLRGGKRIRPALLHYSYLCFEDADNDEVMKACISIELIQSFLLIHDDIMDKDVLRRGKPTVHTIYSRYFNNEHLGSSLALICGDMAFALANELMLTINLDKGRVQNALKELNTTINKVNFGQELDVISSVEKHISEEEIFQIHKLKTAMYTFEVALVIGAILAGAKKSDVEVLKSFSLPIGQAFQLQDDILGLYGDEEKLGKPIGSDIKEGKKTLLMLKGWEKSSSEEKEFLERIHGNPNVRKEDIEKAREIINKTGSLHYSEIKVKELISQSRSIILSTSFKEKGKEFMLDMIEYIKKRDH